MEYQGIVAGIGNKEQNINLIMPEFDSAVNKYIIGKNTIIDGLELDGFTLSAGVCILNGIRGMLENKITLDFRDYVYGRFRKSLIGDTFHIVTSKTELTDDEYNKYLLLYENGISRINRDYPYPEYAKYANQSKVLGLNGVLDAGVTAETLSVNAHELDGAQSKVATVRYVYNQIKEEIDFGNTTITISKTASSSIGEDSTLSGSITLLRKSRYVIGGTATLSGMARGGKLIGKIGTVPNGYMPNNTIYGGLIVSGISYGYGEQSNYTRIYRIQIDTSGNINLIDGIVASSDYPSTISSAIISIGYQCLKEN